MTFTTRQLIWQAWQSPALVMSHVAAVGLTLVLILRLAHYERKQISRGLSAALLLLRFGTLTLILLTLMQPILVSTFEKKQVARILVGFDLSDSMSTIDRHASRGEKFRVARGLELIGNADSRDRLEHWQQALDANRQPEWVEGDEIGDDAHRHALTESRQELLESVFREIDKLPRREISRRLMSSTSSPVLDELAQAGRVELFAFAGQRESMTRDQLDETIDEPPASLKTGKTDLSKGLQYDASGEEEVLGIVLLTDGRDLSPQGLAIDSERLRASQVPVYPILIGSAFRPKDLSILQLEHPETVYKDDHPQIKVSVGTPGFAGVPFDVELIVTDDPDAEPLRRTIVSNGASTVCEFELDAQKVGRRSYQVRIPAQAGETREDNNVRSFSLSVVDDRAKVLIIDGEARWEFRYLEAAFSRDERIQLRQIVFEQPHLGILPRPFFPNVLPLPADPLDLARSPFADCDLVVIGDVSPHHLTEQACQFLQQFVAAGGTLVISAGPRWMPRAFQSPIMQQLLPVTNVAPAELSDRMQEAGPLERGLRLTLTADGEQQPMLQFAPDLAENIAVWKKLPGQVWAFVGDAKPSSTVWATTEIPHNARGSLESDRKLAVIVHQFVGSGQVVWLGFDGTWRWRFRVGDQYHHRFWAQLARWAGVNKMTSGTEFVRFGPESVEVETHHSVRVLARWTQPFLQKNPHFVAKAEIRRVGADNTQPFTTLDLTPTTGQPLTYEGRVASLPAGEYRVRLTANQPILGDKVIESHLFVTDKPTDELLDLSANRELLAKIATATGGRLLLPNEVHELPRFFHRDNLTTFERSETSLWDRWPWLICLLVLMTGEWIIRKVNGLP